jgi:hypothetical protein
MPGDLPALRPDGRRYPQTLLSGSYLIRTRFNIGTGTPDRGRLVERGYVIYGWGWGHQVGMSQYGAKAMADAGSTYDEILAHYYGGLQPTQAGSWLPSEVSVGLAAGVEEVVLAPDGLVDVTIDGVSMGEPTLGSWRFQSEGGFVRVIPPVGLGLPPAVEELQVAPGVFGDDLLFTLTAPAEVMVSVVRSGRVIGRLELGVIDAGSYEFPMREVLMRPLNPRDRFQVVVEAVNPDGSVRRVLIVIPGLS